MNHFDFGHFSTNLTGLETERALRVEILSFSTDLPTGFVDNKGPMILQIALDTPLRGVFDCRPPAQISGGAGATPRLGVRVRVPFGRQHLIGILVGIAAETA